MVYNYISVYNVVEKLYRDYDHQEELDVWDVVEWAAEALEFIGAGQQYERRVAELHIKNNIARLPCNFHSQPIPSYNGKAMELATGAFGPMNVSSQDSSTDARINGQDVSQDNFPSSGNMVTSQGNKLNPTFYVKDGIIVTSINEGTVILEYRAIATDKEGFPKIPDLVSYRTAVTKYVQMMLDHRDLRKGRVSERIAMKTEQDWQWYCKQARGTANMPNLAYAESIKNMWVKLKPNQNSAQSFYNDLTIREMKKTK